MARDGFTIIELLREQRIDVMSKSKADKRFRWGFGQSVAAAWRKRTGRLSPKKLQPKTHQGGKCSAPHDICTYPLSFKREALKVLARFTTTRDTQGDLFDA